VTDPEEIAWLQQRSTPMPTATHTQPLPEPADGPRVPTTYVLGAALPFFVDTANEAEADGVRVVRWDDAAHYLPLQFPRHTAELLLGLA
jgi:hypothetical protein